VLSRFLVMIDCITTILLDLQLPSFDTVMYNYKFSFSMQFTCSGNVVDLSCQYWNAMCACFITFTMCVFFTTF